MAVGVRPNPMLSTNTWNRVRYTVWAPVYDLVGRRFDARRRESIRLLEPKAGERILIVGAGTGGDLPHLPPGVRVLATDLARAMLARARERLRPDVRLAVMDGQRLAVVPGSFDGVVLHLILAVIADPVRCLQEAAQALRPGGRLVVFDKFVRGERVPLSLRALNLLAKPLFTDVTRRFEDILERSGAPLRVEHDAPALLGGFFRHLLLGKTGGPR